MKQLACLVLVLAACKSDPPAPKAEAQPEGRSAKIELPTQGQAKGRDGRIPQGERMKHADVDGDGQLSDEERQAEAERRSAEMAKRADLDGDGKVTEEEVATARKQRAETMHSKLDADHDGKLTIEEVNKFPFRRIDAATVDANKDGVVTVDELSEGLKQSPTFGPWRRRGGGMHAGQQPGQPGSGG